jgi:hypothetical protein
MPLPIPPRTPTPPPDEDSTEQDVPLGLGLEGQLSPARLGHNPNALSPMSATFPTDRYGTLAPNDSLSQRPTPSTVFSPQSAAFPQTPASGFSGTSEVTEAACISGSENVRNPFNFQSVQYMPGRPQTNKSVSNSRPLWAIAGAEPCRMLAGGVDTSTSTAVSHIKSSLNPLPGLPFSFLLRCRYPHLRNTA